MPTHTDEVGSFRGGEGVDRQWGIGDFSKSAGFRDDVHLDSLTPDDRTTLWVNNPAMEWDWPAMGSTRTNADVSIDARGT